MLLEGSYAARILFVSDFQRINCRAEGRVMSESVVRPLASAIKQAGIPEAECAFTCIHARTPPDGRTLERIPLAERQADIAAFKEFLRSHSANVIIPLGSYVTELLTGLDSIQKWQCSIVRLKTEYEGRKAIPIYHPEYLMKSYGDSFFMTLGCMKAKKEMLTSEIILTERKMLLNPDFDSTMKYLRETVAKAAKLAVDIETGQGQINTVGFAVSASEAIAIRVLPEYYTPEQHLELWQMLASILENDTPKILQNFIYEDTWFARYGINMRSVCFDTMWAMKFMHPEFDKGLDNVGRVYTDFPYWKDDNEDWSQIRDWQRHLAYNCLMGSMKVITDQGPMEIRHIVNNKLPVSVRSLNEHTGEFEYKPVIEWHKNRERSKVLWRRIKTVGMGNKGGLRVTQDHKILTTRGWLEACDVKPGDMMMHEKLTHQFGTMAGTLLGDSSLTPTSSAGVSYVTCSHVHEELINLKKLLFGGTITVRPVSKSGYATSTTHMHHLYVPACTQLTKLTRDTIIANLYMLNDMGIALWFMDDGCKQVGKCPSQRIALQRYSNEEREVIRKFFESRFESKASLHKAGNLAMSVDMSRKFCAAIGNLVPPQLRYKLAYEAPAYDEKAVLTYASRVGKSTNVVASVHDEYSNKAGDKTTSYCITVKDNHNFMTEYGIVANCSDTLGSFEAYNNQLKALEMRNLDKLFLGFVMRFAPVISEMCRRGLLLDPQALLNLKDKLETAQAAHMEVLTKEFGARLEREVNPRSPKQLQAALRDLGMKLPTKSKKDTGEIAETTDKKALVKLKKKYPKEPVIPALLALSATNKQLSSYVNFEYDRATNKVHYSLDGCGTESGRWAGFNSGWGEGFNPQTVPKPVRNCFMAEPGKVLIQIDLAQAESRYVAWEAPEPVLMGMLLEGRDVHKYVAGKIFKKPEEIVSKMERQLGKKSGHSANYSVGPRTFAESCLVEMNHYITEDEAKRIIQTYFEVFPGIRRRQENIRKAIQTRRMLKTPIGRERHFYGRMDDSTFREAYSYCPQSVIPDITNHLMLKLWDEKDYLDCEFLLQVHDSLLLQAPPERVEEITALAKDLSAWHPEIQLAGGKLLIPVEVEVGDRWGKMETV